MRTSFCLLGKASRRLKKKTQLKPSVPANDSAGLDEESVDGMVDEELRLPKPLTKSSPRNNRKRKTVNETPTAPAASAEESQVTVIPATVPQSQSPAPILPAPTVINNVIQSGVENPEGENWLYEDPRYANENTEEGLDYNAANLKESSAIPKKTTAPKKNPTVAALATKQNQVKDKAAAKSATAASIADALNALGRVPKKRKALDVPWFIAPSASQRADNDNGRRTRR